MIRANPGHNPPLHTPPPLLRNPAGSKFWYDVIMTIPQNFLARLRRAKFFEKIAISKGEIGILVVQNSKKNRARRRRARKKRHFDLSKSRTLLNLPLVKSQISDKGGGYGKG